jgi:hypothetical protein
MSFKNELTFSASDIAAVPSFPIILEEKLRDIRDELYFNASAIASTSHVHF